MSALVISIIIPTKDRGELFFSAIDAAYNAIKNIAAEIIVVNDSKTSDIRIDEKYSGKISVYKNSKSGVASARNFGASLAKGQWLLFLDDDMVINEDNILSYLKYVNTTDKICVNMEWVYPKELISKIDDHAFGRFLANYGFTSMRGWCNYPDWPNNSSIEVTSITSQNLFLSREHFTRTDGYDEAFPHAGFEDYAFSKNLEKHDFKIYVDTTSLMYHNEVDRVEAHEWFKRKERGGETRRVAVEQGFNEMKITYKGLKKIIYMSSGVTAPVIRSILLFTSRVRFLDLFSFKFYKILLGMAIYNGYTKGK